MPSTILDDHGRIADGATDRIVLAIRRITSSASLSSYASVSLILQLGWIHSNLDVEHDPYVLQSRLRKIL
jgi:hypothetical protein